MGGCNIRLVKNERVYERILLATYTLTDIKDCRNRLLKHNMHIKILCSNSEYCLLEVHSKAQVGLPSYCELAATCSNKDQRNCGIVAGATLFKISRGSTCLINCQGTFPFSSCWPGFLDAHHSVI